MKKAFLVFYTFLLTNFVFAQMTSIEQIDNPLLPNAIALQYQGSFAVQTNFDFNNYPLDEPIELEDTSGNYLGSWTGMKQFGQNIKLRYAILDGLEAQVGFRHNVVRRTEQDPEGVSETSTTGRSSNWVIGGRYSYSMPRRGLSLGVEFSFIGKLYLTEPNFATDWIEVSLLVSKELNDKHQLTFGTGLNTQLINYIPFNLLYMYTPTEQIGLYSKTSYICMLSSISRNVEGSMDLGAGAYYAFNDKLRIDLAGKYLWHNYYHNLFGNTLQLNLAVAYIF